MRELTPVLQAILDGSTADGQESSTLDFEREGKSKQDVVRDLAQAAACFANAQGGSVVVGVHDRVTGNGAFEGIELDADIVLRRIYELTVPSLDVGVLEAQFVGKRLLIIEVPRSPTCIRLTTGRPEGSR